MVDEDGRGVKSYDLATITYIKELLIEVTERCVSKITVTFFKL